MFGNLIGVLLGVTHPLTLAYKDMWTLLQTNVKDNAQNAIDCKGCIKPSHILCSIQLMFYTWFMHCHSRLTPPTPDLKSILHHILIQTSVLPDLPPQLYKLAYPKKAPTLPSSFQLHTRCGSDDIIVFIKSERLLCCLRPYRTHCPNPTHYAN